MTKKNKVWRPAKVFKPKPKENIIRSRWRPRKNLDEENNKILNIKNIIWSNNKIKIKSNIDKITRWLLIFSVLLFIFSIFIKNSSQEKEVLVENKNIPEIKIQTGTVNKTPNTWQENKTENLRPLSEEEQLIFDFYKDINAGNFDKLWNYMDTNLKRTDVYRIYFSTNRLSKFISNISNNTVYIVSIKEIPNDWWKSKKYTYQIKYKLKNNDILFTEDWNVSIVYKDNIPLLWSIMCSTTWCSKNPFFNPQRYWIK